MDFGRHYIFFCLLLNHKVLVISFLLIDMLHVILDNHRGKDKLKSLF